MPSVANELIEKRPSGVTATHPDRIPGTYSNQRTPEPFCSTRDQAVMGPNFAPNFFAPELHVFHVFVVMSVCRATAAKYGTAASSLSAGQKVDGAGWEASMRQGG